MKTRRKSILWFTIVLATALTLITSSIVTLAGNHVAFGSLLESDQIRINELPAENQTTIGKMLGPGGNFQGTLNGNIERDLITQKEAEPIKQFLNETSDNALVDRILPLILKKIYVKIRAYGVQGDDAYANDPSNTIKERAISTARCDASNGEVMGGGGFVADASNGVTVIGSHPTAVPGSPDWEVAAYFGGDGRVKAIANCLKVEIGIK